MINKIKSSALFQKFLSFSVGGWIALLLGFVSTPITTRLFNPDELGKASMYNLAINVLMIIMVLGADQAYVRFFYEEEEEKRHILLRKCISFPISILFASIPFIFIFRSQFSEFLFSESLLLFPIFAIVGIALLIFQRFSLLVVRMEQKGKVFSVIQVLMKFSTICFTLLFFSINGSNFRAIIGAQIAMLFVTSAIAFWHGREHWKLILTAGDNIHTTKSIINYGLPLVFTAIIMWLFQSFDRVAIKTFSNFDELGIYVAAFRIVVILNMLQMSFTTFWAPVAYEKYEKEPNNTAFFKKINIIVTVSMLTIGVISVMGKEIISLIVGEKYRSASQIMPFLIFMPVMYTISETTGIGIGFKKKTKYSLIISIVICIFNIVGNFFLVPLLGGKGAAISTGLSYVLFLLLRTFVGVKLFYIDFHFKRLFLVVFMLIAYTTYSSFTPWSLIDTLYGFIVIVSILTLYFSPIKKVIKGKEPL